MIIIIANIISFTIQRVKSILYIKFYLSYIIQKSIENNSIIVINIKNIN